MCVCVFMGEKRGGEKWGCLPLSVSLHNRVGRVGDEKNKSRAIPHYIIRKYQNIKNMTKIRSKIM